MNFADIINTKAGQDLLNEGKLPPVEVKIQTESIVMLAIIAVIAVIFVLLINKILHK